MCLKPPVLSNYEQMPVSAERTTTPQVCVGPVHQTMGQSSFCHFALLLTYILNLSKS